LNPDLLARRIPQRALRFAFLNLTGAPMNKLLSLLLASLFASLSFAASHTGAPMAEAMKAGDPKAEAAAQAKVDARTRMGDKSAMQPEAMKSGSDKAQANAEMKKARKKSKPANSTDEQMKKDAAKL
jgi:hypothetical protein